MQRRKIAQCCVVCAVIFTGTCAPPGEKTDSKKMIVSGMSVEPNTEFPKGEGTNAPQRSTAEDGCIDESKKINVRGGPPISSVPTKKLNEAWAEYGQGKNVEAIVAAQKLINEFEPDARQLQKELLENKSPLPPDGGLVSCEERDRILQFGPLNDVAAAWYIKGRALDRMGKDEKALEALKQAAEYPHARVYDKDFGGFWSIPKSAQAWITKLQEKQQPMSNAPPASKG